MLCLQREHEKQGAMFSCFYWAVFSWNLEETAKRRTQVPSPAHWGKVLVKPLLLAPPPYLLTG